MPKYIATYSVEVFFEPTDDFMILDHEYEFDAVDEMEANMLADQYCQTDLYKDIMPMARTAATALLNLSVTPTVENVEEE